jgi:hypothetical protein
MGKCGICKKRRKLETHHIISQTEHPEYKDLPGNQIEICRECHEKTTSFKLRNKKRIKGVTCFNCGRAGHMSYDCPRPKRAGKKRRAKRAKRKR